MNMSFFQKFRFVIIGSVLLIVFIISFLLNTAHTKNDLPIEIKRIPTITPFPTTGSFSVLNATPFPNTKNVPAGEIVITFTTDMPIKSATDLVIEISPSLMNGWVITNSFPSKNINLQVLGGLEENTSYTVTVKNKQKNVVYTWSFTTGIATIRSSTKLQEQEEKDYRKNNLPLLDKVPYATTAFSLDYIRPLTLEVKITSGSKATVQTQVEAWIRSQGVDPATHTIIYK